MKRFGILLIGGVLAFDHWKGLPATYAHRSSARRVARKLFAAVEIVPVTVYDADDPANPAKNGLPSFVVERT